MYPLGMEDQPWPCATKAPVCLPFCAGAKTAKELLWNQGQATADYARGRGAARQGSPSIPWQQWRTLPAAVRELGLLQQCLCAKSAPKGTSDLLTQWPHSTFLPSPRQSPRACTAPGAAQPLNGGSAKSQPSELGILS